MKIKNLKKTLFCILACLVLALGFFFTKDLASVEAGVKKTELEEIEKNSDIDKMNFTLISAYNKYYKDVNLPGNNLIDGSFANRTVFVFTIDNLEKANERFKGMKVLEKDKVHSFNYQAFEYGDGGVLVIAVCDGAYSSDQFKFQLSLDDKEVEKEVQVKSLEKIEEVNSGDIAKIGDNGGIYKEGPAQEVTSAISKNGQNGAYFEYRVRIPVFFYGQNLELENLEIAVGGIDKNLFSYQAQIEILDRKEDIFTPAEDINTTGHKYIDIIYNFFIPSMNEHLDQTIKAAIKASTLEIDGNKIIVGG